MATCWKNYLFWLVHRKDAAGKGSGQWTEVMIHLWNILWNQLLKERSGREISSSSSQSWLVFQLQEERYIIHVPPWSQWKELGPSFFLWIWYLWVSPQKGNPPYYSQMERELSLPLHTFGERRINVFSGRLQISSSIIIFKKKNGYNDYVFVS